MQANRTNLAQSTTQPTRSLQQTSSPLSPPLPAARLTRAGSTLATATSLGAFPPGKRTIQDSVGQGNATDFLQFEVTARSRIRMLLSNDSRSRIKGAVLDANGAVVSSTVSRSGQRGEVLVPGARPGLYYLRIQGAATGTNRYRVNLFVNRAGGPEPLPCGCGT